MLQLQVNSSRGAVSNPTSEFLIYDETKNYWTGSEKVQKDELAKYKQTMKGPTYK